MSRSRRKFMCRGLTADSERADKLYWHRSWRRRERLALAAINPQDAENHLTLLPNEIMDTWSMAKDGKVPYSERSIEEHSEYYANWRGHTAEEKSALKKRWRFRHLGK